MNSQLRVAIFGLSGAGKSTTSRLVVAEVDRRGLRPQLLKIAEPLYQIERLIYALCDQPLVDPYEQDGVLLRSLADNFRRINPQSLLIDFGRRAAQSVKQGIDVVVCDDMRAPDLAGILALGFKTIRVSASDVARMKRRELRGDLTAISDSHAAEAAINRPADYELENNGDINGLRRKVARLLEHLLDQSEPSSD